MTIHKEGKGTLGLSFIVLVAVNALVQWLTTLQWLEAAVLITSIVLYAIVLQFFRNPTRTILVNPEAFLCPADGKIVTIEEVYEPYLIKEGYLQRTPRGRMVTERAYSHLGKNRVDKGTSGTLF